MPRHPLSLSFRLFLYLFLFPVLTEQTFRRKQQGLIICGKGYGKTLPRFSLSAGGSVYSVHACTGLQNMLVSFQLSLVMMGLSNLPQLENHHQNISFPFIFTMTSLSETRASKLCLNDFQRPTRTIAGWNDLILDCLSLLSIFKTFSTFLKL